MTEACAVLDHVAEGVNERVATAVSLKNERLGLSERVCSDEKLAEFESESSPVGVSVMLREVVRLGVGVPVGVALSLDVFSPRVSDRDRVLSLDAEARDTVCVGDGLGVDVSCGDAV